MPLTRKSIEFPVRATRSQGSPSLTTPVKWSRSASQKIVTTKTALKIETKEAERAKPTAAKAESVIQNPREESIQTKRKSSRKTDKTSTVQYRETDDAKQEPVSTQKTKKRHAGHADVSEIKKHKSSSVSSIRPQKDDSASATMFSPRRSSRAVIPNSRYKDMEMIETVKRKPVDSKDNVKFLDREKGAVRMIERTEGRKTSDIISTQSKSEPELVTEEFITEETPIDAHAQMNLFDEVLILPTASVAPPTSNLQQILPPAMHSQEPMSASPAVHNQEPEPVSAPPAMHSQESMSTTPAVHSQDPEPVSALPAVHSQEPMSAPPAMHSQEPMSAPTADDSQEPMSAPPDVHSQKPISTPSPTITSSQVPDTTLATHTVILETKECLQSKPVSDTYVTRGISTVPVVSSTSTKAVSNMDEEEVFIPADPHIQSKPSFWRHSTSPSKVPSPQVIVVRSGADSRKDKVGFIDEQSHANLMPKFDNLKRKLAENVLLNKHKTPGKPNVIVLGPEEIRKRPRKIIVTPTHTAKNEANKKAKAESERLHQSGVKVVDVADKPTSLLSSVLTGKTKTGISHEPGKRVIDLDTLNVSKATIPYVKDTSVSTKIGAETITAGALGSIHNIKYSTVSEDVVENTMSVGDATFTAMPLSKVTPQVVYVRAKHQESEHDAASSFTYDLVTSSSKIAELDIEKRTMQKSVETLHDTDGIAQEDSMQVESDVDKSTEEIAIGNGNLKADGSADLEEISVTQATRVIASSGEEVIIEENNEVERLSDLEEDKKSADETSSYCQVIPVEQQKREVQTAIEYVVFGDKMVPIHKPMSQVHGRITTAKQQSGKRHGRVEIIGQGRNGADIVRKIPVNAAQTAISSVLAQIGDKRQPVVFNSVEVMGNLPQTSDTNVQLVEPADDVCATEETSEQHTRVIHGYIDRQSDTVEPTQIVEISQDLFAKEVYGETVLMDQVSGEVMPESVAGVVVSQPMVTETMVTAMSTDSDLQPLNSDIVTQADRQTEEEPFHEEASLPLVAGQTDTEAMQTESRSGHCVNQSVKIVNKSEETVNQLDEDEEHTEVMSSAVSTVTKSVPASENATVGELVAESDPKVMTQYNRDGSMTICIEGAGPEQSKMRFSTVTVPNIIRVDSSKPGVYKPENTLKYKGIPAGKVYSQSKHVGYKKLLDVKINPAVTMKKEKKQLKPSTNLEPATASTQTQVPSVSTAVSTQTQTEMETQTESMEELDDGEEEEGSQLKDEHEVMIVNSETDPVRRTTRMTIGEDGQVQEYVVVSLPEGKEIKNYTVPPVTRDPVHDEVVTMSEDGMYVCLDCDHKTEKKSNWYKHRRKHLGIRPHACSRCNYRAATSSNLKRHMQIHDDIRNFFCNVCNLFFRQKIHLERHIKYKHQEKKVKCPLCDYLCSSENPDLKIHIRRRHMPHEGGNMAAFTCEECGLMTVSRKDLKQHMKFHKKGPELKLFCEFCSFVTDCESRLRRHMLIHTKEKPFQCGLCSYRASQKEHVLRHMRSQHDVEVERRSRRSLLDETSRSHPEKRRRSLLEGMAQTAFPVKDLSDDSGDGDKPFEKSDYSSTDKIFACNHCSMKFSKLINLYKHLYVQHKQVMPDPTASDFQCVVCEFRTNNKKNLLVHMRKHNMQDHTPPSHVYSCVLCRYMNPRRRNLFQHMKKKHGIEIVMKEDGSNCYVTSDNTSVVLGNQPGEANVMALSEIVTTETIDDDSQLQIVTEDGSPFQGEKISIDNIISVEDMAAYVSASQDQPSPQATIVSTSLYQTVAEHEAAEAIEGLQALAQQPGVLETQTIDNDITAEIVTSEILTGEEMMSQGEPLIEDPGIQLSSEQINQLSTGDYVEINGEVYKVEIANEGTMKVD